MRLLFFSQHNSSQAHLFYNSFLKNQNLMKNLIKLKNNKTLLLIYRFVIYLCKLALKLQFALDSCNIQQVAQRLR